MITDYQRGLALGVAAMLIFSCDALSVRIAQIEIGALVSLRSLIGTATVALLMVFLRLRNVQRDIISWPGVAMFTAATAVAQSSFVLSVGATAAINTLVIISAAPLFSAALAAVVLSERTRRHTWAAALVVSAAPLLAFLAGPTPGLASGQEGQWYALLCMVASSVGLVTVRRFVGTDISLGVLFGNLLSGMFFLPQLDLSQVVALDWIAVLYGGVGVVGIAFYMLYFAARLVPPAEMSLLFLIELTLAPLILWVVVDEQPAAGSIAAGVLVAAVFIAHTYVSLRRSSPVRT